MLTQKMEDEAELAPGELGVSYPELENAMLTVGVGYSFPPTIEAASGELPKLLSYAIEPALPDGLVLSSQTGSISGKPTEVVPATVYSVTVTGDAEASTHTKFTVMGTAPPKNLVYPDVEGHLYYTGHPISLKPTVEGDVQRWSTRQQFPAGLALDVRTGVISGVPTDTMPEKSFTIVAKNADGYDSTVLRFRVVRPPPDELDYHEDGATTAAGEKGGLCGNMKTVLYAMNRFMRLYPTVEGDVTKFTISPELPEGLNFYEHSGVISGTPIKVTKPVRYTVTAENDSGPCRTHLTFAIKKVKVESLSYPAADDVYAVGEDISLDPVVAGSATGFSIDPGLPKGVELNASTGRISGRPTDQAPEVSYTVIAWNKEEDTEDMGASCIVTFEIEENNPEGLSYRVGDFNVGQEIFLEPDIESGHATSFAITPDLPIGLALDATSGAISGRSSVAVPQSSFTVRAYGANGFTEAVVALSVKEVQATLKPWAADITDSRATASVELNAEGDLSDEYSREMEMIRDLKDMPAEPNRSEQLMHWMIWMVHRVQLDDPSLTALSFSQLPMPLPKDEPRVGPKLMRAIGTNTNLTTLDLSSSNMRPQEAMTLAESLRRNSCLKELNVDGNHLDADAIFEIASALTDAGNSGVTILSCQHQLGLGVTFGRRAEQAVVDLVAKNSNITRLGFQFNNEHLASSADSAIRKNRDALRRRRRRRSTLQGRMLEEKEFSSVSLGAPPDKAVMEFFQEGDGMDMPRQFTSKKKRVPTREQLQAWARNHGQAIKYSEAAPLVRSFRKVLLDACSGVEVTARSSTGAVFKGILTTWVEKNDKWDMTLLSGDHQYQLTSPKDIVVEVTDEVAVWLWWE